MRSIQRDKMTKEQLQTTVKKMIKIVRADTGASPLYVDMLLSLMPNNDRYKVNLAYWCYKADRDDFEAVLELIRQSNTDLLWDYEALVSPYKEELEEYIKSVTQA